ncbi:MAG TPA: peroxiredoxin [Prolixibacteraceae bacterium]|nr:peroxiredoxin [Prolixibacteraceae bacterium]
MKKVVFLLFAGLLSFGSMAQGGVKPGDKVPVFTAVTDDEGTWSLKDFLGKKNVVLYFYPAAMTGGCTKQACSYRDHVGDLKGYDAVVAGISGDDPASLKIFRKAHQLNYALLSDPDGVVARLFGVPVSDGGSISRMVGDTEIVLNRGVTAQRWTFIIGKDGVIKYVNQQVDAENDYKAVLEVLSSL